MYYFFVTMDTNCLVFFSENFFLGEKLGEQMSEKEINMTFVGIIVIIKILNIFICKLWYYSFNCDAMEIIL